MPAILRFKKELISQIAFDLVAEGGLDNLSTSTVSQKLQSSVKPIYTHYSSMDNLKREVASRIVSRLNMYIYKDYGEEFILTNVAIGQALFAYQNKNLYLSLFAEENPLFTDILSDPIVKTFEYFKKDPALSNIPDDQIANMYMQMSNYMYGLNMAICNNWFDEKFFGLRAILGLIKQMVQVLYRGIIIEGITNTEVQFDPFIINFDKD